MLLHKELPIAIHLCRRFIGTFGAAVLVVENHHRWIIHDIVAGLSDTNAQVGVLVIGGREAIVEPLQLSHEITANHQEDA